MSVSYLINIIPHLNLPNATQLCYNTPMNNYANTKKMTIAALMAALALIFSYVEVLIPFTVGIPGIKLGVANIVIIIALYYLGPKYAITVNVVRVIIAGLLFNGLFGALYSLAGAIVSFIVGSISVIVPTPNGAGPWHFAVKTILVLYGVASVNAEAFALIVHTIQTALVPVLGIFSLIMLSTRTSTSKP